MLTNQRSALFMSYSKTAVDGTQALLMAFFLFRLKLPAEHWKRTGLDWFWLRVSLHLCRQPLAPHIEAAEEAALFPLSHFPSSLSLMITMPVWSRLQSQGPENIPVHGESPQKGLKPAENLHTPHLLASSRPLQGNRGCGWGTCCTLCLIQRFLCPGKTFCWLLQTPDQMFSHLPKVAILYKHPAHLCCFWFQSSFTWLEIILVWYTSLPVKANPCPPCQSKHSYKGRGITLTVHKICFHIMLYRTHCCWRFLHLYYMNLLYLLDWHSG